LLSFSKLDAGMLELNEDVPAVSQRKDMWRIDEKRPAAEKCVMKRSSWKELLMTGKFKDIRIAVFKDVSSGAKRK
jgi:hypothetical protein